MGAKDESEARGNDDLNDSTEITRLEPQKTSEPIQNRPQRKRKPSASKFVSKSFAGAGPTARTTEPPRESALEEGSKFVSMVDPEVVAATIQPNTTKGDNAFGFKPP